MNYRGIELEDCPTLYRQDGALKGRVLQGLDILADMLREKGDKILSKYKDSSTKILVKFNCEHEPHLIKPAHYKNGKGCPKCSGKCSMQAKEEFERLVEENHHDLIDGEYTRNTSDILIDFKCGHKPHWTTPSKYKMGCGCPKCGYAVSNNSRIEESKKDFIKLLETNNHRWIDGEYKNSKTKVLIKFECDHKPHWIIPNDYKHGYRCPHCSESKGERVIRTWLEKNGIAYESQHVFGKLPNHRYDFFLPCDNLVVEVHGIQHYEEIKFFGNRTLLEEQKNDKEKREGVESLGYNYMEVDYRESNPELTLDRFIKQYKSI